MEETKSAGKESSELEELFKHETENKIYKKRNVKIAKGKETNRL